MLLRLSERRFDALLRLFGLGLLALCWALVIWLYESPGLRAHHDPSWAELAAAGVAYLSFSLGGALLTLGHHVLDQVQISTRWGQGPRPSTSAFSLLSEPLISSAQTNTFRQRNPPDRPVLSEADCTSFEKSAERLHERA